MAVSFSPTSVLPSSARPMSVTAEPISPLADHALKRSGVLKT